jgi:hypothetical protein
MLDPLWRSLRRLLVIACGAMAVTVPARADEVLFTFGEMQRLKGLPVESAKRTLSEEEVTLYQNFEFYAYSVFEALQVANNAALSVNHEPLFCAPEAAFHFREQGDIARLADYVLSELFALTEEIGDSLDRYADKPASAVLLLGLRAAFPCPESKPQLAQR